MVEPINLFYCKNKDTYPPFKNGLYLEEYFIKRFENETPYTKRKYIPLPWTNFQIESWFQQKRHYLQENLDEWIKNNPSENGYFTIVQYDDGPLLKLPKDTIIYGACSGNVPIPLIYEDKLNKLSSQYLNLSFSQKSIKCSFIGTNTHPVRTKIIEKLKSNCEFVFSSNSSWTPNVSQNNQDLFVKISNDSRFGLAPRGYGRSSFRFFELFKLGVIPIYVWDDIEWLPYKDIINYSKICFSININDITKLPEIINSIDETKYKEMWTEYEKIKYLFTLEGMYDYIIEHINKI